jgi:hypothetical protein
MSDDQSAALALLRKARAAAVWKRDWREVERIDKAVHAHDPPRGKVLAGR